MSASSSATPRPPSGLQAWLQSHALDLEPGLQPIAPSTPARAAASRPGLAADATGRPVLVLWEEDFDPTFFEQALDLAATLPDDAARAAERFPRAHEPRLIVLAARIPREVLDRLAVLARAVPLRAYLVTEQDAVARPALLPLDAKSHRLPGRAPGGGAAQEHLARVLAACEALVPPPAMDRATTPWLVHVAGGVLASIHVDVEPALLCARVGEDAERLELQDEVAADQAIDLLLRAQGGVTDAA